MWTLCVTTPEINGWDWSASFLFNVITFWRSSWWMNNLTSDDYFLYWASSWRKLLVWCSDSLEVDNQAYNRFLQWRNQVGKLSSFWSRLDKKQDAETAVDVFFWESSLDCFTFGADEGLWRDPSLLTWVFHFFNFRTAFPCHLVHSLHTSLSSHWCDECRQPLDHNFLPQYSFHIR